jgi:hypothetical protein
MIKEFSKIKLKSGKYAVIVEILEYGKAYMADIEISEGDFETKTISHSDIDALIVEVEQALSA